jgi:hypothetical protein
VFSSRINAPVIVQPVPNVPKTPSLRLRAAQSAICNAIAGPLAAPGKSAHPSIAAWTCKQRSTPRRKRPLGQLHLFKIMGGAVYFHDRHAATLAGASWEFAAGILALRHDPLPKPGTCSPEKSIISHFNRYTPDRIWDVSCLVDLVRFELTTLPCHLRNINHLQTVWRKTKDLAKGWLDASGRHWAFSSETARSILSRARLPRRDCSLFEQTTSDSSIRMMPSGAVTAFAASKRQLAFSQYCE